MRSLRIEDHGTRCRNGRRIWRRAAAAAGATAAGYARTRARTRASASTRTTISVFISTTTGSSSSSGSLFFTSTAATSSKSTATTATSSSAVAARRRRRSNSRATACAGIQSGEHNLREERRWARTPMRPHFDGGGSSGGGRKSGLCWAASHSLWWRYCTGRQHGSCKSSRNTWWSRNQYVHTLTNTHLPISDFVLSFSCTSCGILAPVFGSRSGSVVPCLHTELLGKVLCNKLHISSCCCCCGFWWWLNRFWTSRDFLFEQHVFSTVVCGIWVFTGLAGATADVHCFDINSNRWSRSVSLFSFVWKQFGDATVLRSSWSSECITSPSMLSQADKFLWMHASHPLPSFLRQTYLSEFMHHIPFHPFSGRQSSLSAWNPIRLFADRQ